jgi:hypothetical protein
MPIKAVTEGDQCMPCKAHLTRLHTDHSKCVE